ncbi:MAG: ComEC/Rec2 family competence protein [Planctomycetota bacterium]
MLPPPRRGHGPAPMRLTGVRLREPIDRPLPPLTAIFAGEAPPRGLPVAIRGFLAPRGRGLRLTVGSWRARSGPGAAPSRALAHVRKRLGQRLDRAGAAGPHGRALLLGERITDRGLAARIRRAGASHFFAVSGLHLGLVALLVRSAPLPGPFARRRDGTSLVAMAAYALLAGAAPPVLRALAAALYWWGAARFGRCAPPPGGA